MKKPTITAKNEMAKLAPKAPKFDRDKAQRAAAGIRELSRGLALGGLTIKSLVDAGRR